MYQCHTGQVNSMTGTDWLLSAEAEQQPPPTFGLMLRAVEKNPCEILRTFDLSRALAELERPIKQDLWAWTVS